VQFTQNPPTDMLQVQFDKWNAYFSDLNVDAFFTHGVFSWLTTVNALNRTAVVGVITSLILAFIVLIVSTSNIVISSMAMSSIFCIMATGK
jgi:hypothetical protein